jgi:dihydropteroate synthase
MADKNMADKSMAEDTATGLVRGAFSGSAATAGENVLTRLLDSKRPLVMGVLNVTPDSFSDGGRFLAPRAAIEQAERLAAEGADILDIGAESTRPYGGAVRVPLDEERQRLDPVLRAVVALGVPVSIDTLKAPVAAWALEAGAAIVNDVWGLQRDPDMARVVAEHEAPVIIMHNREAADPAIDIIKDVTEFFSRSLEIAWSAGIHRHRIVLDPGIGFGKTPEQSLACIARLHTFAGFGLPVLVGASRKRFIASIVPSEPMQRLGGSIAAHLLAVEHGAAIVRAHDVAPTVQALAVAAAIRRAR